MTRDEVLEEAALALDAIRKRHEAALGPGTFAEQRETLRRDAAVIRSLKSKPPVHEVLTDVHRLADERDALKRQVEELEAQLAKAKAQATKAEATVDRMRWEARGAPMRGEPMTDEEVAAYERVKAKLFRPVLP